MMAMYKCIILTILICFRLLEETDAKKFMGANANSPIQIFPIHVAAARNLAGRPRSSPPAEVGAQPPPPPASDVRHHLAGLEREREGRQLTF